MRLSLTLTGCIGAPQAIAAIKVSRQHFEELTKIEQRRHEGAHGPGAGAGAGGGAARSRGPSSPTLLKGLGTAFKGLLRSKSS